MTAQRFAEAECGEGAYPDVLRTLASKQQRDSFNGRFCELCPRETLVHPRKIRLSRIMIESNKNSIIGRLNRGLISTKKQFNSTIITPTVNKAAAYRIIGPPAVLNFMFIRDVTKRRNKAITLPARNEIGFHHRK